MSTVPFNSYECKEASTVDLVNMLNNFDSEDLKSAMIEHIEKDGITNIEREFIDKTVNILLKRKYGMGG